MPANEAKGVVSRSPLLLIPNFCLCKNVTTEYLHSVCLGVCKRCIELTFSCGENRSRITNRKLSSPLDFNKMMLNIKMFKEFSRRCRELDFAVYKGQEYRNIVLFFFIIVVECIEKQAPERKLWLQFAFFIRACVLPANEFRIIDLDTIEKTAIDFYNLYEKLFGQKNCSYNTHVVCSHVLEMRYFGPFTSTSAFPFESFYGEIRNSFTPGTQSTLKQAFQKILLKRALGFHSCQSSIHYSANETNMENDTIIYCYQNSVYNMYKINEVHDDHVICNRQGRYPHTFQETPNLNFSQVGVYKRGPQTLDKVKIMKKNIAGKVLPVLDFLITCPNNVLREK